MSINSFVTPTQSESQSANHDYATLSTRPINGALGAEVDGINLAEAMDDVTFADIRQALLNHQVIVFRDQKLSPADLKNFGEKFGDLHINPFVHGVDGVNEVIEIRSEENDEKRFTGLWHSDISWGEKPSLGSILYAVELPEFGGDTLFSNMYLAYQTLSDTYKELLGGLNAEHRVDQHNVSTVDESEQPEPVIHPVIRTHPETKQKALFVNEYFTSRFENMTIEESRPMLGYLFEHSTRPDFTCRIQWQPGTVVFWDNRCTMHYATNDYPGQKRLMHRITINGDRPY